MLATLQSTTEPVTGATGLKLTPGNRARGSYRVDHVGLPCKSPFPGAPANMPEEVADWLKAHAWKACVPQGTVGSNPATHPSKVVCNHAGVIGDYLGRVGGGGRGIRSSALR